MDKKITKDFIKEQQKKLDQEKALALVHIEEFKKVDPFQDPDHATDNAAIDTDVREQIGHDTIEAEVKDLQRRVKDIDLALKKIAEKDYGYCERCHAQIPLPRLKLVPEARYCIDCEKLLVRS